MKNIELKDKKVREIIKDTQEKVTKLKKYTEGIIDEYINNGTSVFSNKEYSIDIAFAEGEHNKDLLRNNENTIYVGLYNELNEDKKSLTRKIMLQILNYSCKREEINPKLIYGIGDENVMYSRLCKCIYYSNKTIIDCILNTVNFRYSIYYDNLETFFTIDELRDAVIFYNNIKYSTDRISIIYEHEKYGYNKFINEIDNITIEELKERVKEGYIYFITKIIETYEIIVTTQKSKKEYEEWLYNSNKFIYKHCHP